MNKTKILISTILAITMMMPIVLAATPSLFPDFTEIGRALVKIFTNQSYDAETVETILRFALLIISIIVIHRILNYTLGEEGTAKKGLLTDKLAMVISIITGLITALLTPFELLMNGIAVILAAVITFFLLEAMYIIFKKTETEEKRWETIVKLATITITAGLFTKLIIYRIGQIPSFTMMNLPTDTFDLINKFAKATFWILIIITTIQVINFFYNKSEPTTKKTKLEKAKEQLKEAEEETEAAKIGLKKTTLKTTIQAIKNTDELITTLKNIQNAYSQKNAEKILPNRIREYINNYMRFTQTENTLKDILKEEIDNATLKPALKTELKTLVKDTESLTTTITNKNNNLIPQLEEAQKSKEKIDETKDPHKKILTDSKELIKILQAILHINTEIKNS